MYRKFYDLMAELNWMCVDHMGYGFSVSYEAIQAKRKEIEQHVEKMLLPTELNHTPIMRGDEWNVFDRE